MDNFLLLLSQHLGILYVLTLILGLCIGSFLNVIIYRLPLMLHQEWRAQCTTLLQTPKMVVYRTPNYAKSHAASVNEAPFNLCFPSSHCPKCAKALKWWHNIPLISFLLLGGCCYYCGQKIAWRYVAIELVTALISVLVVMKFGASWQALGGLIFCWSLIALTGIDIDHQLLPDSITLSLLWLGLLINTQQMFTTLTDAVISSAGAYLTLWVIIKLFYLLTGKIGMGHGDFKLFAAFGAWFGSQLLPLILVMASLVGAIVGILVIYATRQTKDTAIAFGPFLALAAIINLFYGTSLLHVYLSWL